MWPDARPFASLVESDSCSRNHNLISLSEGNVAARLCKRPGASWIRRSAGSRSEQPPRACRQTDRQTDRPTDNQLESARDNRILAGKYLLKLPDKQSHSSSFQTALVAPVVVGPIPKQFSGQRLDGGVHLWPARITIMMMHNNNSNRIERRAPVKLGQIQLEAFEIEFSVPK